VTFDVSSHRRLATESDNWPLTWSDDDNQYAVWGDGGGFGSDGIEGRVEFGVARVTGDHDDYQGFNRFGGLNAECPGGIRGKGHGAPLSIGGVLYVWFTPSAMTQGFDTFILFRSRDKGCTWTLLDAVAFTREQEGVSFGSFVQFGKDNGLAPDAYVYTVAVLFADDLRLYNVQRPGKIMLIRVPRLAIEDRGAYEFYAGQDSTGQPKWSTDAADKVPIYEDPLGVGPWPQMSFVPGLQRLVYTNQHGDGIARTGPTGWHSLLTMAEAPHPWGPFTVFYRDLFAPEIQQNVFQWNFAPKWFRNGGREFTLTFSGNGVNDSWNTIDGKFSVEQ
jgi:hypothetical protein